MHLSTIPVITYFLKCWHVLLIFVENSIEEKKEMYRHVRKLTVVILAAILALLIGTSNASPSIRVNAASPTITVTPPAAPPGVPITVTGTGFTPSATVNLKWFGYIIDIKGTAGHIGYYTIKAVTANSTGGFKTSFPAPYDFSDIKHAINATQNGVGSGITNATFTIAPTMSLSPLPANYTSGQQVTLYIYGGTLGEAAVALGLPLVGQPGVASVIKLTFDNNIWGFTVSHINTEGPIVTGGFTGGDVGGNVTVTFKAVGGVGAHSIRGYTGSKDTPPYLQCLIGGETTFNIIGPSADTQSVLSGVTTATSSANTAVNYGLIAIAVSAISLVILLAVAVRVFRRP